MGLAPPNDVTNLRLLGIVTTVFCLVGIFIAMAVFAAVFVGLFTTGAFAR